MTDLLLIRHGQTEWNVAGRYQGQKDPPLNETGIGQAETLAKNLCGMKFHAIYTSPLQRCLKTAQIIADLRAISIYPEPRLMEINQGVWEGQLYCDIKRRYPEQLQRWEQQPWLFSPPDGETLEHLQARVITAIEYIRSIHRGQIIGVVTHQLPLRVIKVAYQKVAREKVLSITFPNCYYELLKIDDHFQPSFLNKFDLPEERIF
jgi:alpha-ribazole phosphatase